MEWFNSNSSQKEFMEHLMSTRLIGSLSLDINNFIHGKYSLKSERIDAVYLDENTHNKILHLLSSFKNDIRTSKKFELPKIYSELESALIKIEDSYDVKFKTIEMYNKCADEYNSMSEKEETQPEILSSAGSKSKLFKLLKQKLAFN